MQALNELAALRVEDDDLRASIEYTKGVTLAVSSGLFIGASFIIKKKGLLAAGESGLRAAAGGFSYLREPLWWLGMVTMIGGECANFAAYAYAPAIVVTPLGATTIVSSAIFANCFLGETLHACGAVGCALCVLGSIVLVSFAPEEAQLQSVEEIWVRRAHPSPSRPLALLSRALLRVGSAWRRSRSSSRTRRRWCSSPCGSCSGSPRATARDRCWCTSPYARWSAPSRWSQSRPAASPPPHRCPP